MVLGRKSDGDPEAKALWCGLQRIRDFAEGIKAMAQFSEVKLE